MTRPEGKGPFGLSHRPTKEQKDQLVLLHLLVARQSSGLADCIRHILKDEWDGWVEYATTEIADLFVIAERLCEVLELDPDEVRKLGFERDEEKREAHLRRHPGALWV